MFVPFQLKVYISWVPVLRIVRLLMYVSSNSNTTVEMEGYCFERGSHSTYLGAEIKEENRIIVEIIKIIMAGTYANIILFRSSLLSR